MPKSPKGASTERQQVFENQFKKTVICRFYLADACKKGSKCTFAHTIEELNEVPDLRKTALCKLFKRGLCTLSSDRCPFAHSKRELRMSPAFQQMATRKRSGSSATASPASDASTASTRSPDNASEGSQSAESPPLTPGRAEEQATPVAAPPSPTPGTGGKSPSRPGKKTQAATANAFGMKAPQPQAWETEAAEAKQEKGPQLEPAFVQVPSLLQMPGRKPSLDGLLDTSEKLLLGATTVNGFRPAFVNMPSLPAPPGLSRVPQPPAPVPAAAAQEGKSALALAEWIEAERVAPRGQQPPPPPPPPPPPHPQQRCAKPAPPPLAAQAEAARQAAEAARQAAELRAIASEAEKKAAAYAQEAALLKLRAETAERALVAAAAQQRAPLNIPGLIPDGRSAR